MCNGCYVCSFHLDPNVDAGLEDGEDEMASWHRLQVTKTWLPYSALPYVTLPYSTLPYPYPYPGNENVGYR